MCSALITRGGKARVLLSPHRRAHPSPDQSIARAGTCALPTRGVWGGSCSPPSSAPGCAGCGSWPTSLGYRDQARGRCHVHASQTGARQRCVRGSSRTRLWRERHPSPHTGPPGRCQREDWTVLVCTWFEPHGRVRAQVCVCVCWCNTLKQTNTAFTTFT